MLFILLLASGLQPGDPAADGMKALAGQKYEEGAKLYRLQSRIHSGRRLDRGSNLLFKMQPNPLGGGGADLAA